MGLSTLKTQHVGFRFGRGPQVLVFFVISPWTAGGATVGCVGIVCGAMIGLLGGSMPGPIVFISHFNLRPGKLAEYRQLQSEIAVSIESEKPATLVFLAHLNADSTVVTVTHVFPDSDAMDRHFEGSDERSAAAFEVMSPAGWAIYGAPSDAALENIRGAAAASGVPFVHVPEFVAGFVRASS